MRELHAHIKTTECADERKGLAVNSVEIHHCPKGLNVVVPHKRESVVKDIVGCPGEHQAEHGAIDPVIFLPVRGLGLEVAVHEATQCDVGDVVQSRIEKHGDVEWVDEHCDGQKEALYIAKCELQAELALLFEAIEGSQHERDKKTAHCEREPWAEAKVDSVINQKLVADAVMEPNHDRQNCERDHKKLHFKGASSGRDQTHSFSIELHNAEVLCADMVRAPEQVDQRYDGDRHVGPSGVSTCLPVQSACGDVGGKGQEYRRQNSELEFRRVSNGEIVNSSISVEKKNRGEVVTSPEKEHHKKISAFKSKVGGVAQQAHQRQQNHSNVNEGPIEQRIFDPGISLLPAVWTPAID